MPDLPRRDAACKVCPKSVERDHDLPMSCPPPMSMRRLIPRDPLRLSYGRRPDSTAHIGQHRREPVGGAIHGERIGVMTRRRCAPQGRGERI
jgi:hypothetical protein